MRMYSIVLSNSARRYLKKLSHSGAFNSATLHKVMHLLESGEPLPEKFKDHRLHGEFSHLREFHLGFNLLVLYERDDVLRIITVSDIGTHPELFGE